MRKKILSLVLLLSLLGVFMGKVAEAKVSSVILRLESGEKVTSCYSNLNGLIPKITGTWGVCEGPTDVPLLKSTYFLSNPSINSPEGTLVSGYTISDTKLTALDKERFKGVYAADATWYFRVHCTSIYSGDPSKWVLIKTSMQSIGGYDTLDFRPVVKYMSKLRVQSEFYTADKVYAFACNPGEKSVKRFYVCMPTTKTKFNFESLLSYYHFEG